MWNVLKENDNIRASNPDTAFLKLNFETQIFISLWFELQIGIMRSTICKRFKRILEIYYE